MKPRTPPIDRAMLRLDRPSDDACWTWQGYRNRHGYGRMFGDGKVVSVHRVVYEALIGPIPRGLELDHLCQNRACANPAHLEAVTHAENLRRARKTHCIRGHNFEVDGVRIRTDGRGRQCAKCIREYRKTRAA